MNKMVKASVVGAAGVSLLMGGFLGAHNAQGYVWAFRWSVIVLGMITLAASLIFSRLRETRVGKVVDATA